MACNPSSQEKYSQERWQVYVEYSEEGDQEVCSNPSIHFLDTLVVVLTSGFRDFIMYISFLLYHCFLLTNELHHVHDQDTLPR
jgi:hypothetical protein